MIPINKLQNLPCKKKQKNKNKIASQNTLGKEQEGKVSATT